MNNVSVLIAANQAHQVWLNYETAECSCGEAWDIWNCQQAVNEHVNRAEN